MSGDRAILFIEITDEGKFRVTEEGKTVLRSLKNNLVSVITIAGPQRTGKSFLANRLLSRMSGFAIGPSTVPCTKGIWFWSQSIKLDNMDVLIMDTEGLNSIFRDGTTDSKILGLVLLLSSILVYNTMGLIDEQALNNLSLVIKTIEMVKIGKDDKVTNKKSHYRQLAQYFPYFLWALRDFSLDLNGMTSDDYLNKCLREVQGSSKESQEKNQLRRAIKELFKERSCETFIRPMNDELQLSRIEEQSYGDLKKEFRDSVKNFISKVHKNLKPKMIDGKGITGTMLLELTLSYVTAFNEGSFPEIKSSLERVIEREVSGISKSKAKKYMAVLGVNLKKVQEGDIEGYYKIYKTVMNMLEKDLKALAEARRDISLFWQIKEKVVKKMDEKFKDYLEYKQGAADKYNEELVKKLKENIGVPRTLPITKYFEESRLKKFHKGMIDWLSGSLNSDKTMTLEIVKLLCSYYERYAMEGHSIAKIEMSKIQDDLDLEKNNQETYKEMIKQQNKYAGEMDSEFDKMRSMLKRKDREIEALNSTTSSSKDTMMVRLRALEGQCADYKEENSLLQKKLMRLKSDGGLHNPNLVKGDYKDLENYLEKNGKDLTKEQFSSEFERYKKTVHNAISSANKKVNIENTRLKSEFVDYKKKLKEVLEQKEKLEEQLKDKQDYIEDTCQQKKLDEFWRLEVECKRMKADKDAFFWVLAESLKKAKKKKTANLENALKLLCEEDQKEVMNIFKSVGLKVKLK